MNTTEARLQRLEKTAARARRINALLGAALVATLGWSATAPGTGAQDQVRTRLLEIVDPNDQVVLRLAPTASAGGKIEVLKNKGEHALVLAAEEEGGVLLVGTGGKPGARRFLEVHAGRLVAHGTEDQSLWQLGAAEGAGRLLLNDEEGQPLVNLGPDDSGVPALRMLSRRGGLEPLALELPEQLSLKGLEIVGDDGGVVATLGSAGPGAALELCNTAGGKTVQLSTDASGNGHLELYSRSGKAVGTMEVTTAGEGSLAIRDGSGTPLVRINPAYSGKLPLGGELGVYNKTGERVCVLRVNEEGVGEVAACDRAGECEVLAPH